MLSAETLLTFKLVGIGIAVLAQSSKIIRVASHNRRSDETIGLKLLLPYSAFEIDGSYDAGRKKVMRFANSMTVLFYFAMGIIAICLAYPRIAASLNLV